MFPTPPTVKMFLARHPTDLRRSFDGLSALVRDLFDQDPVSGHLFVFFNRRLDRVKILYFDHTGLCLWYKRLERGRFHPPATGEGSALIRPADLTLILEGIDLAGCRRRKRFRLPAG